MKKSFLAITILILTFASTPFAQETCKRHTEPKGGFSFCPPTGWSIEEDPGAKFKIVVGPRSDVFTPNLNVSELKAPVSLSDVVSFTVKRYSENAKNLGATYIKVLKQSEFTTFSKQQGVKVVFQSENKGRLLRTTQYFFSGKRDSKLIITFTALEKESEVLDPIFDSSIKTLEIDE